MSYLSRRTFDERDYRLSERDPHWNDEGHAYAAQVVYGLIRERGLLPDLELAPWPEAEAEMELERVAAREEMDGFIDPTSTLYPGLAPELFGAQTGRQVLGGIDAQGRVDPTPASSCGASARG